MDVCLVTPPVYNDDEAISPSMGILSIASYLRLNNVLVRIIDFAYKVFNSEIDIDDLFYQRCAQEILKVATGVLGITTQNITLPSAINIAKNVKRNCKDIVIVFGGPGSDAIGEELLNNFDCIDFIVQGEGEITFLELFKALESKENLHDVNGLIWRDENGNIIENEKRKPIKDLNWLPKPAFDLVPSAKQYKQLYNIDRTGINVELARGCCHSCYFCGCSSFWNGQRRTFSIDRVVDTIEEYNNKFEINHIYLSDDNFLVNNKFAKKFAETLIDKNIKITWDTRGRIDSINKDILETLTLAGCSEILIGVESCSDDILEIMNKKVSSQTQFEKILMVSKAGILPIMSFVIGYPTESIDSLNKTLDFVVRIYRNTNLAAVHFHMLSLIPGTKLYDDLCDNLDLKNKYYEIRNFKLLDKKMLKPDIDLIESYPKLFSSFYNVVTDNIDIYTLERISKVFPDISSVFPFTFSLLKKIEKGDCVQINKEFSDHLTSEGYDIFTLTKNELKAIIITSFYRYISKKYFNNLIVVEMCRYEIELNKIRTSNKDSLRIDFHSVVDVNLLKNDLKNEKESIYIEEYLREELIPIALLKFNSVIKVYRTSTAKQN